jgi:hypothetical protein
VQFDLKDAVTVPADLEGKQQHVVEIANFVDAGTSIWLKGVAHNDFHATTLLETVAQFFQEDGLPAQLTFDNDPRFVGSTTGRDFPSAQVALSASRWALSRTSVHRIAPTKTPLSKDFITRSRRNGGFCIVPARWSKSER